MGPPSVGALVNPGYWRSPDLGEVGGGSVGVGGGSRPIRGVGDATKRRGCGLQGRAWRSASTL